MLGSRSIEELMAAPAVDPPDDVRSFVMEAGWRAVRRVLRERENQRRDTEAS